MVAKYVQRVIRSENQKIIIGIKHTAKNVKVGWARKEERNKNLNYGKEKINGNSKND